MNLTLEPIHPNEDQTKAVYASDDCQTLIEMWKEFYPQIGFDLPWIGYFIKLGNQVVGTCAFTGKPADNRVELSYWTFKEHEGKGIATQACKELISIAQQTDSNLVITAKTAPEKNASTTILERNGFKFSEVVLDHEIGDAWEWILVKNSKWQMREL